MSRTGNPYDNATMESFFGTLKIEEVQGRVYRDAQQARAAIFSYIEAFYNSNRIHTSLAGLSPCQFETCQNGQQISPNSV